MRVLLDTFVWIDLKAKKDFLTDFIEFYRSNDIEIVFSHGNFMDLSRRPKQDKLSKIIGMFADEYCGPMGFKEGDEPFRSEDPIILTKMDHDWYEYCQSEMRGYSDSEKLQTMFRESSFDAESALSHTTETVEGLREWGEYQIDGELNSSEELSDELVIKIIKSFPEYQFEDDEAKVVELADVPLNIFVFRMSLVYLSETNHDFKSGDFRDAHIWSEAILHNCDVLWTEPQWQYQHPVISRLMDRIECDPLSLVHDYEGFRRQFNGVSENDTEESQEELDGWLWD